MSRYTHARTSAIALTIATLGTALSVATVQAAPLQASNDCPVSLSVKNNDTIKGRVVIEAKVAKQRPDKVVFLLDGPRDDDHTERNAPYTLFGGNNGKPYGWDTTKWPDGRYTLKVTAERGKPCGQALIALTVANKPAPTPKPTNTPPPATPKPTNTPPPATPKPTNTPPPATPKPTNTPMPTPTVVRPTATAQPTEPPVAPQPAPPQGETTTFEPRLLSEGTELMNPMRGLYKWRGAEYAPQPGPSVDVYDRFEWRDLEPRKGVYDFTVLERKIAEAANQGRRFAFRIRAEIDKGGVKVPDYLVGEMSKGWWMDWDRNGSKDTYVPDWNDPDFIAAHDRLVAALAQKYDGDPRIAWVEIGIYGIWGEWHVWNHPYPAPTGAERATDATLFRYIDPYIAQFKETQLIMLSEHERAVVYAMQQSPTIGWRRDSLGSEPVFKQILGDPALKNDADRSLFMNRWKTAPVVTEFINPSHDLQPSDLAERYRLAQQQARDYHIAMVGNGNTVGWSSLSSLAQGELLKLGRVSGYRYSLDRIELPSEIAPGQNFTMTSRWSNLGVTPTYDNWNVTVQLRKQGQVATEFRSTLKLRELLPTKDASGKNSPRTTSDTFKLPDGVQPGTYDLVVVVTDPKRYLKPLALAITGVQSDGSYRIGTVEVR